MSTVEPWTAKVVEGINSEWDVWPDNLDMIESRESCLRWANAKRSSCLCKKWFQQVHVADYIVAGSNLIAWGRPLSVKEVKDQLDQLPSTCLTQPSGIFPNKRTHRSNTYSFLCRKALLALTPCFVPQHLIGSSIPFNICCRPRAGNSGT